MSARGGVVILTPEDKKKFKEGARTLKPVELLAVVEFVDATAERFTKEDLRFMHSCLGKRAERLLRNAGTKFTWDD